MWDQAALWDSFQESKCSGKDEQIGLDCHLICRHTRNRQQSCTRISLHRDTIWDAWKVCIPAWWTPHACQQLFHYNNCQFFKLPPPKFTIHQTAHLFLIHPPCSTILAAIYCITSRNYTLRKLFRIGLNRSRSRLILSLTHILHQLFNNRFGSFGQFHDLRQPRQPPPQSW